MTLSVSFVRVVWVSNSFVLTWQRIPFGSPNYLEFASQQMIRSNMKRKTSDLNICLWKLLILLLICYFTIYKIFLFVKLLLNHSSHSLRDALRILPSISHNNLRMFDTNFTFQNFYPYTQNEQRTHTIVITQVWKC